MPNLLAATTWCALLTCVLWSAPAHGQPAKTQKARGRAQEWQHPGDVTVIRHIVYEQRNGQDLSMQVLVPANHDLQGGTPALPVVLFFGGGKPIAELLTKNGFAMASVRVRFGNGDIFPAAVQDAKSAVRFLRAHAKAYNLDGAHIGTAGSSKGGLFASMLGTMNDIPEYDVGSNLDTSSRVQAVLNFCGHTDLTKFYEDGMADPKVVMDKRIYERKNRQFLGCGIEDCKDTERKASPLTHVSKDDAPFLLITGDTDRLVPVAQLTRFHGALQATGVESTLDIVPGASHGMRDLLGEKQEKAVIEFLTRHLKPAAD